MDQELFSWQSTSMVTWISGAALPDPHRNSPLYCLCCSSLDLVEEPVGQPRVTERAHPSWQCTARRPGYQRSHAGHALHYPSVLLTSHLGEARVCQHRVHRALMAVPHCRPSAKQPAVMPMLQYAAAHLGQEQDSQHQGHTARPPLVEVHQHGALPVQDSRRQPGHALLMLQYMLQQQHSPG